MNDPRTATDDHPLIAAEAIACDRWVVRGPRSGKAYQARGFDDGNLVVGKTRRAYRAGDEIPPGELTPPERTTA